MFKIENSQANKACNSEKIPRLSFPEKADDLESDDTSYNSKMKIECICPKCGARHRVKLLWTGRGVPRKFCPICKHYSNSINDSDPCNVTSLTV
jgi:transposase-like protein